MRTRSLLPALLLPAVLALTACGGSTSDDGIDTPAASDPAASSAAGSDGSLQLREVTTTNTATGEGAPTSEQQVQLDAFDCEADTPTLPADEPMVACDADGTTYLLEPAAVDGGVASAAASQDAAGAWVVDVELGPDSSQRLADLSGELVGTADQVALVLDGVVLSAPTISSRITSGSLQVSTGDLDEASATDLAEKIQAGA